MGATAPNAGYGAGSLEREGEGGGGYHQAGEGEDDIVPSWRMEGRGRLVEVAGGRRKEEYG